MSPKFLRTLQATICRGFPPKFMARRKPDAVISISRYTTSRTLGSPWTQHPLKSTYQKIEFNSTIGECGATIPKAFHKAFIALGSNLGDRIGMIERACNEMSSRGINIKRTSSLWETEPMYVLDQANFINGVCEVSGKPKCENCIPSELSTLTPAVCVQYKRKGGIRKRQFRASSITIFPIETSLEPLALLDELQKIENIMGREKIIDKGPRNIDLDILLYDNESFKHERLQIPHPLMYEREFVLRPLAELIPGSPIDPKSPWAVTQDYLNVLPESEGMSTVTPLSSTMEPLRPLKIDRKTKVMAIINVTPDSFSGGRKMSKLDATVSEIGEALKSATVAIIDIGGQSTAPGAKVVTADKEASRAVPLIQRLQCEGAGNIPRDRYAISIDTYYASVAEEAVEAGADIINDVSAGAKDPDMLPTMARLGKTIVLMHMRGDPSTMNTLTNYPDGLIPTIASELLCRIEAAEKAGIRRWRIILDPGIGFAKTGQQNLEILRRLDELRNWPGLIGFPWLVGSSRKNFIGKVTGIIDPKKRIMGTSVTVAAAVFGGADIVRVHDAEQMVQVAKMSDAIWRLSPVALQ